MLQDQLPAEVWFAIFHFLTPRDLCRVAQTCRAFWELSMQPTFWSSLTLDQQKKDYSHVLKRWQHALVTLIVSSASLTFEGCLFSRLTTLRVSGLLYRPFIRFVHLLPTTCPLLEVLEMDIEPHASLNLLRFTKPLSNLKTLIIRGNYKYGSVGLYDIFYFQWFSWCPQLEGFETDAASDKMMTNLCSLHGARLRVLDIRCSPQSITHASVDAMAQCPRLVSLHVPFSRNMSSHTLHRLTPLMSHLSLLRLHLFDAPIRNDALVGFFSNSHMIGLRGLSFQQNYIDPAILRRLPRGVEHLELAGHFDADALEAMDGVFQSCSKLISLKLQMENVNATVLIRGMTQRAIPNLKLISFFQTIIDDFALLSQVRNKQPDLIVEGCLSDKRGWYNLSLYHSDKQRQRLANMNRVFGIL